MAFAIFAATAALLAALAAAAARPGPERIPVRVRAHDSRPTRR